MAFLTPEFCVAGLFDSLRIWNLGCSHLRVRTVVQCHSRNRVKLRWATLTIMPTKYMLTLRVSPSWHDAGVHVRATWYRYVELLSDAVCFCVVTGFYPPTSGDAFMLGSSLTTDMPAIRKNVGICPQHDVLYPILTVREHLNLYARYSTWPYGIDYALPFGCLRRVSKKAKNWSVPAAWSTLTVASYCSLSWSVTRCWMYLVGTYWIVNIWLLIVFIFLDTSSTAFV